VRYVDERGRHETGQPARALRARRSHRVRQSTACGTDPLSCLGKALGGAKASAAQTKLGNDYCGSCSLVGGNACNTAFVGTEQIPGLGFALLPFGDAPIAEIDSACTKSSLGKTACQAAFTTCVGATTTKFLATTVSADSAKCLIEGIKAGLVSVGGGGDASGDGAVPVSTCGPDNCSSCCTPAAPFISSRGWSSRTAARPGDWKSRPTEWGMARKRAARCRRSEHEVAEREKGAAATDGERPFDYDDAALPASRSAPRACVRAGEPRNPRTHRRCSQGAGSA